MRRLHSLAAACSWLLFASGALAQVSPANAQPGTVTVSGSSEMTKPPEIIRVMVKQYAKGTDQEAAKTALVAVEKKLMTKLGDAGATIIVSHAGVAVPSQNLLNRYRNVSSMMLQRRMAAGDNSQQGEKSLTYLERFVTVDVKPKDKNKEAMTLLADLQERIRKDYQDLSGMNEALPKDESNDNNRAEMTIYRNDSSMYSTDVRFQMAARITRQDRLKLYAEAMKRAKAIASDLAEAAEMKVGPIQSINSSFSTTNSMVNYGGYQRAMTATGEIAKFPLTLKEDGSESIAVREVNMGYQGPAQEPISFQINLNASFKLEPAK